MNTDFFALPGLPSVGFEDEFSENENNRGSRQMCMFSSSIEDGATSIQDLSEECRNSFNGLGPPSPGFILQRDLWVMPMLGLSAMNVLVILAFEIFVICKATGSSPSRR